MVGLGGGRAYAIRPYPANVMPRGRHTPAGNANFQVQLFVMPDDNNYFVWLEKGGRIRTSVRAIIFDQCREQILVEKNLEIDNSFFNFIGGGVEVGETLAACIERELSEETNAGISEARYLFIVENFLPYEGEIRHGLEHYFAVTLDRRDVVATNPGLLYEWIPIDKLGQVDLRPGTVRDCLIDGSYRYVRHLVVNHDGI